MGHRRFLRGPGGRKQWEPSRGAPGAAGTPAVSCAKPASKAGHSPLDQGLWGLLDMDGHHAGAAVAGCPLHLALLCPPRRELPPCESGLHGSVLHGSAPPPLRGLPASGIASPHQGCDLGQAGVRWSLPSADPPPTDCSLPLCCLDTAAWFAPPGLGGGFRGSPDPRPQSGAVFQEGSFRR